MFLTFIIFRSCLRINENIVSSPGYHPILNTIRLGAAGRITHKGCDFNVTYNESEKLDDLNVDFSWNTGCQRYYLLNEKLKEIKQIDTCLRNQKCEKTNKFCPWSSLKKTLVILLDFLDTRLGTKKDLVNLGNLFTSRWTRVNLNSNWTDLLYRPKWCTASTGPTLFYVSSVSTLMARPDFLQYPANHRPVWPIPLA